MDHFTDAFITLDQDYRITYINLEAARINKKTQKEFFGKTHWEEWPASVGTIVEQQYRKAMEERIAVHFEHHYYVEKQYDVWLDIHAYPIEEGLAIFYRDISDRKRSEEMLHQQAALLDDANVLVRDMDSRIIYWNQGAERLYGWTSEEAIGQISHELFQTQFPESREATLKPLLEQGYWDGELIHKRRDGSELIIATHQVLYYDTVHNPIKILEVNNDLTSQRRFEEALRRSEANLKKAQITANVGSWIWHIPTNRLEWSDQMYHIFNVDKETFTGDLVDVINQAIHPDDREKVTASNIAVIEQHTPIPLEYRIVWRDGTVHTVWAEAGELLLNEKGEPVVLSGFVQDITERKNTEKIIRSSEERLRLALSATQQGIYDINLQTGEIIVNDTYAAMLGYDPAVFVETGERWMSNLHPEDRDWVEKEFQDYIEGKISEYRVEARQKSAAGDWKWILSVGKIVEWDHQHRPLRMLGMHTDITERKNATLEIARLLAESQRRMERIETLRAIDVAISSNYDLKQTLDVILNEARAHLQVDAAVVLLYHEDERVFKHADSLGFRTDIIQNARVDLEDSLVGKIEKWGDIAILDQADYSGFDSMFIRLLKDEAFQKYYGIALTSKGKLIGVLELYNRSSIEINDEWRHFFKTLAWQAGVAIENAKLIEGLQYANLDLVQAYDATIAGWSMAMDLRDKETEGHTQRVTEMTLALARMFDIPEDQMEHIRRGALLHDIGKMGIPDAILLKPGLLTDEERAIMQTHPKMAYDMLKSIDYLRPALEIPHLHHEKWDGSGYPYGLKGEEIPLSARLFAVIDVYDALTSDRPYRPAWSKEKTIAYIQEQSGKYFDPEVVKQFLSII